jgi:hypothetical protein
MFTPSHFSAVLLFASFTSVVFGITQRNTLKPMLRYGAATFGLLTGAAIVLSWVMFLLAR